MLAKAIINPMGRKIKASKKPLFLQRVRKSFVRRTFKCVLFTILDSSIFVK